MEKEIQVIEEQIEQKIDVIKEPIQVGASGTIEITENGVTRVVGYEYANVQVPIPTQDVLYALVLGGEN